MPHHWMVWSFVDEAFAGGEEQRFISAEEEGHLHFRESSFEFLIREL